MTYSQDLGNSTIHYQTDLICPDGTFKKTLVKVTKRFRSILGKIKRNSFFQWKQMAPKTTDQKNVNYTVSIYESDFVYPFFYYYTL